MAQQTKMSWKRITDFSVKDKAMKHLKENPRAQGLGSAFLEMASHQGHGPLKK